MLNTRNKDKVCARLGVVGVCVVQLNFEQLRTAIKQGKS